MPDRSSSQGPPDDWSRGSHSARGPYPGAGASDAYGPGMAGARAAAAQDGYGAAGTAAYRAGNADGFRTGTAGPFGDADPFGEGGLFGPAPGRAYGAGTAEAATAHANAEPPTAVIADSALGETADAKGFLGALFDFRFTSFVTPKVIKVLYALIMISTMVSALVFTIIAFRVSTAFGILTLLFADPLFILIVMAISRMILEFFVVAFRMAEDIRALREGDDLG
jgi:hypothetical protein